MKLTMILAAICFLLPRASRHPHDGGWTSLLDKDLSRWEMYLGYRHRDGYAGEVPRNAKGEKIPPVGYNKNKGNTFSVSMQDGAPVLRISGEYYGCVFTKEAFQNYHLRLMVKFGTKKWPPRKDDPRDSGLLYHSQGPAGVDYWRAWMRAQEFQIMEGGFGDYWCAGAVGAHVKMHDPTARNDMGVYDPQGEDTPMGTGGSRTGFVQHSMDYEKRGEWNTVELICFGDKSIHIVNGHVVMALSQMVYSDGQKLHPLAKGKIQLQSEAAEVYYKNIEIRKLDRIPEAYVSYFK